MTPIWIANIIGLWVFILLETTLLLLLLRGLGELRQRQECSTSGMPGIAVGQLAPSLTVYNQSGQRIVIDDIKGKTILLFILYDCPACELAIQALVKLSQQNALLNVFIVGRADAKANHEYTEKHKPPLPIYQPEKDQPEHLYEFSLFPFVFMLDENGIIRAKGIVTQKTPLLAFLTEAFPLLAVDSEKSVL